MGGETMETVKDFIFLGSKITSDSDFSHEIKRCLLLGRKAMINLDSILKSRDITLTTKDHLVKAMVFPVVIYGRESWSIKKAECWRIETFQLWYWRRLLRVPWTARRSNQSWIFIGSTDAEAETPKLWPPERRNDSFENILMLGKIEEGRRRGWQDEMTRWNHRLDGHEFWVSSGSWWWTDKPGVW